MVERLAGDLAALRSAGPDLAADDRPSTVRGGGWPAAATRAVDRALATLAGTVVGPHHLTVAAVGGYGRGELCPGSDLDLLLLHDGAGRDELEAAVRRVVYPLWDAGLTVGYAVRSRREAIAAVDDLEAATALIDLRTVAGDPGFAATVRAAGVRRLRQRPHRFLTALAEEDRDRRARHPSVASSTEPDLKAGAGGLRDAQSLRWAAAALVGSPGLDPLVAAGYLGAPDRARLARAEATLRRVRVASHLVALRADPGGTRTVTDALRLPIQDDVAALLGLRDRDEHELAPHRLLRQVLLAGRTIDHAHQRAWRLIAADLRRGVRRRTRPAEQRVDGFELLDGVLRLPPELPLEARDLPVRLLGALADTGAVLDRTSAGRLRAHARAGAAGWGWDDHVRRRFLRTLWRGRVVLPALAELDDAEVLTALLPGWEAVRGRPQRSPQHHQPLDHHAWATVAALADLVRREPWAAETLDEVADRDGLLLGALLHDVGKAVGEPHERTGVPVAAATVRHLGAGPTTVALVERLVRWHLLLPATARRRDVTDPALAAEVAAAVGDRATLAALHLLAAADGRATGPSTWSPWLATLVSTLVAKVRTVLDERHPDESPDGAIETVREAQALAPELGADPDAVRAHLALLPARYANAVSARAVVRHTLMLAVPPGPSEVRTRVTPGGPRRPDVVGASVDTAVDEELETIDELDVVAHDHPGWFAKVAGVVSLHGGSIVAADAFTREDGFAVDTFRVRPPAGAGGSWWAAVEGDLAEAAAGRLAVRARVRRQARGDARRAARLPTVATRVEASPSSSGRSTLLEVRTLDRLGVLYAIASAMAELELDLVVARIDTVGHEVRDVFEVRDADGGPLDDDHLAELRLALRAAIDEL